MSKPSKPNSSTIPKNNIRLTNDVVDQRLKGRNIIRVGDYINRKLMKKFGTAINLPSHYIISLFFVY